MYASVVITEYIYPLLTICYISLSLLAVKLFIQTGSKGKGPQNVGVKTYDQDTHTHTPAHAHAHTHTPFSRTHVLFKLFVCRQQSSVLNCVPTVYMLISLYVFYCSLCLYIVRIISLLTCVFILLLVNCSLFNCL